MENQNIAQVPAQTSTPVPVAPASDSGFEVIQKLLMVFIFVLTICMFSYWGYQAVQYILAVSFNSPTTSTLYDVFIGIVAMISSVPLFIGSFIWWKKNVKAEMFLKAGTFGFVIKDLLEIPNAIVPLTRLAIVNSSDISSAATAIGYDLFKVCFWIFALVIFHYAIKKSKQAALK